MAGVTKEDRLARVHERALREFDKVQTSLRDERLQCLQDRRFYSIAGAQWEGPLGELFENKARFEVNHTHLAVIRVINEYRNNRISVDFLRKDGAPDDKAAETCAGLYRADEQASVADEAHDNAFEEGVAGGFGAWRLRAIREDEEDDENEQQRVRIEPIFDADSCVFFDIDAKRYDKSDAKRCWVLTAQSRDAFVEEWEEDPASWPKIVHQREFDWLTPDVVFVAEYYEVEEKSVVVHVFRGLDGQEKEVSDDELRDDDELDHTLEVTGFREVRQKRRTVKRVHKYILCGSSVLSDEGYVPGTCIPIVPFYAKRSYVDSVERCLGHVRLAKDAQRLVNMLLSWLGEMASRFDLEKPILTPQQIQGHAQMWADDNISKFPYLLLNGMVDAGGNVINQPMGYTKAPQVPPAMAALMQIAGESLTALLGNQQAGEEMQPNISGKAIELIQNRLDMQVFIYMSNFAKSMKRSGEIWLSMAKALLVEQGRKMKTIAEDGTPSQAVINQPSIDKDTGEQVTENDIGKAALDAVVEVGPSSQSRRAATVRAITGMMGITQDPQTLTVLGAMAMMNMEGEGLSDARDYFRRQLVQLGVVKPTPEEAKAMEQSSANQKPDAQSQYLMASAEQAQADAAAARAKTVETVASAELKRAQTAKTMSDIGIEHHAAVLARVKTASDVFQAHQAHQAH